MPTTASSYYDDYDEYFFDYYDTQHKFFTSVVKSFPTDTSPNSDHGPTGSYQIMGAANRIMTGS